MSRPLKIAWGLFLLAVLAIGIVQGWRFMTRDMIDFTVVYRTGQRILEGQPVYNLADGIMPFKYAPLIAYLFAPFALLPKSQSAFVFFVLSMASFFACFQLAYRWTMPDGVRGWIPLAGVALTFLSVLRVIMNSLDFGQVQVFILLGMLYCSMAFSAGRWLRGGLALSVITISKIVPGVLCVPWLVRKQWRPVVVTVLISDALLFAPALWLGSKKAMALLKEWWSLLTISTNQSMIERWTNQSLLSALARVLAPNHYDVNWFSWDMGHVIILTKIILGLWLGLIVWLGYRRVEDRFPSVNFVRALDLSYYLLFIIVAFPLAWRYHFTSMILPNMLILSYLLCYARRDFCVWGLFTGAFLLSSVVNQELLGSRLFEWFYLRSCMTWSVILTALALLKIDRFYRRRTWVHRP